MSPSRRRAIARGGSLPRCVAWHPAPHRAHPPRLLPAPPRRAHRPCPVAVWPPGLPARAASPRGRAHLVPSRRIAPHSCPHRAAAPSSCAPPVPRCGRARCPHRAAAPPARCAAWQVAHAESFACRGLPAGAPRPRHGARQSRAPGAMS